MWRLIKRFAHRLAVTLYGVLELRDIPKIREISDREDERS
jgi:hypothetical protein